MPWDSFALAPVQVKTTEMIRNQLLIRADQIQKVRPWGRFLRKAQSSLNSDKHNSHKKWMRNLENFT